MSQPPNKAVTPQWFSGIGPGTSTAFIGVACGWFRTRWGTRYVMLRDDRGNEEIFRGSCLRSVSKAEVIEFNKTLESIGAKTQVPMTAEPIRPAQAVFRPFIWCHCCGTSRPEMGKCPKGCKESPLATDISPTDMRETT